MILDVGDRILIKKVNKLSKFLPFGKRKYDWIANVISPRGEIMDCSPPLISIENIEKYIGNPNYELLVLRPKPAFTVAQKAIWFRKIKILEGKKFSKKNKNVNINNSIDNDFVGAATGTLLADNHCKKLESETINSPSDYVKLVESGEFEVLYDSYEE